jgi:hypothetical protein
MTNWRKSIKIKHLLTESEEYADVKEVMSKVADELSKHGEFKELSLISKLRNIPAGDDVITPTDYANKLLRQVYDIADMERIWIE